MLLLFARNILLILLVEPCVRAEGFVEEVACSNDRMTVALNKSDPDLLQWLNDGDAQPIAYVYGYKDRTPCGASLKGANGEFQLNMTIPYGAACGMRLADLEPNYLAAETTITIENNALRDDSKPMRINHVYCLYTSQVQALKTNDVSTGHQVIASTGGKPKPTVRLVIRDVKGRNIQAAKFGDPLEFLLVLSPDNAYKAIAPKQCMFSDRDSMDEPGARTLTFVQSSCPVQGLSDIVQPIQDVRDDIFYTQFQAFRFGNQSTVYAHCKVQVCLDASTCPTCFHQVSNVPPGLEGVASAIIVDTSNLTGILPRRRAKRNSAGSVTLKFPATPAGDEIAISNAFVVLEDAQARHGADPSLLQETPMCIAYNAYFALLLAVGIISCLFLLAMLLVACLAHKLRRKTKDCESRALYAYSGYSSSLSAGTLSSPWSAGSVASGSERRHMSRMARYSNS